MAFSLNVCLFCRSPASGSDKPAVSLTPSNVGDYDLEATIHNEDSLGMLQFLRRLKTFMFFSGGIASSQFCRFVSFFVGISLEFCP